MKWPTTLTIDHAWKIQEQLREKVKIVPLKGQPQFVAGVDAAFSYDEVFASACLYRYPELVLEEDAHAVQRLEFPYLPGYLSFREGPAIIAAVKKLRRKPGVILVDGQGIAHPRGAGIASYVGVVLEIPTIGCAKTRLIGEYREPGIRKGSWSPLQHERTILGAVLRTRDSVNPLFVSPGHLVNLEISIRLVISCAGKYRIPEPLRCADALSRKRKSSRGVGGGR